MLSRPTPSSRSAHRAGTPSVPARCAAWPTLSPAWTDHDHKALTALVGDAVLREALGPAFCDYYIDFKRQEWSDYHNTISPWEQEKYLTLF